MPRSYRPTSLKMASRHCPAVISFLEEGAVYDRRPFEAGIAAHAVLQAIGEATEKLGRELEAKDVEGIAGVVGQALLERGRTFDGNPEPPLSADATWHGRDIALRWLTLHPITPGGRYEVGLAATADWQPCPYDSPLARFKAIVDVLRREEEGDEERAWTVVTLRDYKTAWSVDEGELDTLQLRGHAVLAWLHFGAAIDVIRREVVNLRTLKVYGGDFEHELQMADDGSLEQLRRWRDDLQGTMDSYDRMAELGRGRRPAIPGAGCDGCPFLPRCVEAQDYIERAGAVGAYGTPEERARGFAVASAVAAGLRERLQRDTDEAPVDLGDAIVGTIGLDQRTTTADAYAQVWDAWRGEREPSDELARGLLKALDLGVGSIEKAAKELYPARGDKPLRDDLVDACSALAVKRRFGVWPKRADEKASAA